MMKNQYRVLLSLLLFCLSHCYAVASKDQVMIMADNMADYMKRTIKPVYQEERVRVFVRNGNAQQGLDLLARGQTSIAVVARDLTGFERMRNPAFEEIPVASDALVFITHPDNPIESLTFKDIQRIYTVPGLTWGAFIGPGHKLSDMPIVPISKTQNNGVFQAFMRYFRFYSVQEELSNLYFQLYPYQNDSVKVLLAPRDEVAIARLAVYPNGIAFVALGALESPDLGKNFKVVKFNRVEPSFQTVFHRQYPLTYRLNFIINERTLTQATQTYIDWILDASGQDIFRQAGLAPINLKTKIIQTNTSLTRFRRFY